MASAAVEDAPAPFAQLHLVELYDLETYALCDVVAALDAYLQHAPSGSAAAVYALRQRECASLELEERERSERVALGLRAAWPAEPPPPPPHLADVPTLDCEQQCCEQADRSTATPSPAPELPAPELPAPAPRRVIPKWTAAELDGRGAKPLRRKRTAPKPGPEPSKATVPPLSARNHRPHTARAALSGPAAEPGVSTPRLHTPRSAASTPRAHSARTAPTRDAGRPSTSATTARTHLHPPPDGRPAPPPLRAWASSAAVRDGAREDDEGAGGAESGAQPPAASLAQLTSARPADILVVHDVGETPFSDAEAGASAVPCRAAAGDTDGRARGGAGPASGPASACVPCARSAEPAPAADAGPAPPCVPCARSAERAPAADGGSAEPPPAADDGHASAPPAEPLQAEAPRAGGAPAPAALEELRCDWPTHEGACAADWPPQKGAAAAAALPGGAHGVWAAEPPSALRDGAPAAHHSTARAEAAAVEVGAQGGAPTHDVGADATASLSADALERAGDERSSPEEPTSACSPRSARGAAPAAAEQGFTPCAEHAPSAPAARARAVAGASTAESDLERMAQRLQPLFPAAPAAACVAAARAAQGQWERAVSALFDRWVLGDGVSLADTLARHHNSSRRAAAPPTGWACRSAESVQGPAHAPGAVRGYGPQLRSIEDLLTLPHRGAAALSGGAPHGPASALASALDALECSLRAWRSAQRAAGCAQPDGARGGAEAEARGSEGEGSDTAGAAGGRSAPAAQSPAARRPPLVEKAAEPRYFCVQRARADVVGIVNDVLLQGGRAGVRAGAWARAPDAAMVPPAPAELGGAAGGAAGGSTAGGDAPLWAPPFNLLWTWRAPRIDWSRLLRFQRVNHFPRASGRVLSDKERLKRALDAHARRHGAAFSELLPLTFALPQEYVQFAHAFGEAEAAARAAPAPQPGAEPAPNVWILKPADSSRGRGIRLVDSISQVHYARRTVVQRYVPRPLTLGGRKLDLRLYVLLTSVQPLEAFLYTEGLARLASRPFTLERAALSDPLVHLTNTAVQRHASSRAEAAAHDADGSSAGGSDGDGDDDDDNQGGTDAADAAADGAREHGAAPAAATKISLAQLRAALEADGIDFARVWARVRETVVRSLVAVEHSIEPHPCAFELFGYDVLIEAGTLRPWLIEVNSSPSLERETQLDAALKERLIADTVRLVDPPAFDRAVLSRMASWRLAELGRSGRRTSRLVSPPFDHELHALLSGGRERGYGEMPAHLGMYERIAPSPTHERVVSRAGRRASAATASSSSSLMLPPRPPSAASTSSSAVLSSAASSSGSTSSAASAARSRHRVTTVV